MHGAEEGGGKPEQSQVREAQRRLYVGLGRWEA